MATGAADSGGRRLGRKAGGGAFAPEEQAIAAQIGKTGAQVKLVDLASGVLALLAAVLVYLLVLVLLDHWVVRGGLGVWSRVAALAVLLAGVVAYGWRQLAPLVLRRINPVYAAAAIEQTQPGVKNSLINFLLLRRQREQIHAAVYEAVEQQAARDLARVPAEGAVDRSGLIRVLYVLLVVLVVGCAYKLFSPKDPLASVGRMLAPWARWQAPTRVWIGEIEPGTTQAFYDDRVRVSAVVQGLRRGEGVTLRYSTADGQMVDQGVPMELPAGSYRHEASLPAGVSGLKQDLEYWIVAGDASTVRHRLQVVTAPAILIERVEYHYPSYTGLLDRVVERQGDLRGLVGTEVTLHAVANREITAAHLDYDCDGRNDLPLKLDGERGTLSIVLGLNADGRPEHESYQLRMTTTDGKSDPQPVRYRIDVAVDQAPELEFVEPEASESELAANGVAALGVRALDPDFALASVTLRAERGGEELLREPLLSAPLAGEFRGGLAFDAAQFGLKPGDEVQYWAEARDQRQPAANQTVTTKRLLKIVAQVTAAERQRQEREADEHQEKWNEPPTGEGAPGATGERTRSDAGSDAPQAQGGQESDDARQTGEPGTDAGQPGSQGKPQSVAGDAGSDQQKGAARRGGDQTGDGAQGAGDEEASREQREEGTSGEDAAAGGESGEGVRESAGEETGLREPERGEQDAARDEQAEGSPGAERGEEEAGSGNEEEGESQEGKNSAARRAAEEAARAGERAAGQRSGEGEAGANEGGDDRGEQGGERERIDPESNPGDAFERILKHRQERGGQEEHGASEREPSGSEREQPSRQGTPPPGGQPGGQGEPSDGGGEEQGGARGGQDAAGEESGEAAREEDVSSGGRDGQGGGEGQGSAQGAGGQEKPRESDGSAGQERGADGSGESGKRGAGGRQGGERRATDQRDGDEQGERDAEGRARESGENVSGAENGEASEGGKPRGGAPQKNGKRRGGEAAHSQRQPGAGAPNAEDRGNTSPQGAARPRERRPGQGGEPSTGQQGEQANSPSQSDHESASEGGESGDRSGGGEQGGGQQSSQSGTGGAGSSTESNEGAAGGSPGGEGETGSQSGSDAQGSGGAGGQTSEGGSGQSGEGGAKPGGGESGAGSSGGSPGGQPGGASAGGGSQTGSQGGGARGQRQGGGASGGGSAGPETGPGGGGESPDKPMEGRDAANEMAATADDPNAEYAREATDLVLEYLEDQMDNDRLDPKLLEELHWSREDVERFVRRWRAMQRAAAQEGPAGEAARRKLEAALAGLGLQRRGTTISGGEGEESTALPLEATRRSDPPAEYLEQFKAFTRGTAKARPQQP